MQPRLMSVYMGKSSSRAYRDLARFKTDAGLLGYPACPNKTANRNNQEEDDYNNNNHHHHHLYLNC